MDRLLQVAQEEARRLASRLGVSRCPGVWFLPRAFSPALWVLGGARRIVFPRALWARLGEAERTSLLAHELAHLRRRDHWVRWLELAAAGFYWWHPSVWWARREIERHEEECCDAWVAWAAPEAKSAYGKALLETIEFLARGSEAIPGLASGMAGARTLKRRLTMILKTGMPRWISAPGWVLVASASAACLVHVPVAARSQEREPADGKPKEQEGRREQDRAAPNDPAAAAAQAAGSGLDWLLRHQNPDGSWQAAGFVKQCRTPCRNADAARYGEGLGSPACDVGVTGLALLAFGNWGHTHEEGTRPDYAAAIGKAIDYLKRVQVQSADPAADGRYGEATSELWMYNHAIATEAMGMLLVMSQDRDRLQESVERALKLCLQARNDGSGWRYGIKPGDNDSSVTARMVLALKMCWRLAPEATQEDSKKAFAGALSWFERVTAQDGRAGYMAPGDEGALLAKVHPEPYPYAKEIPTMTAASVSGQLLAGQQRGLPIIRNGVDHVLRHPPVWREPKGGALSTVNYHYWYYGTLALFQYGGEPWKTWREQVHSVLLAAQRSGEAADERGSWDPIDEWGPVGGRVYATALAIETLAIRPRPELKR